MNRIQLVPSKDALAGGDRAVTVVTPGAGAMPTISSRPRNIAALTLARNAQQAGNQNLLILNVQLTRAQSMNAASPRHVLMKDQLIIVDAPVVVEAEARVWATSGNHPWNALQTIFREFRPRASVSQTRRRTTVPSASTAGAIKLAEPMEKRSQSQMRLKSMPFPGWEKAAAVSATKKNTVGAAGAEVEKLGCASQIALQTHHAMPMRTAKMPTSAPST